MFRSLLTCVLLALSAASGAAQKPAPVPAPAPAPAAASTPIPTAPVVDARAYILVDYRTGKILAAKEAVARMEPASLTKLMTAYIVFEQLAAGKLKLDEQVTVSEKAWRSEGSRTFIEVGKPVPVQILILGMIVQSGNDATVALAERVAGTEETFAQMMNTEATRLGMVGTHFENSSGLPSAQHYTTARDMSLLAAALVRDYPQYYKWFSMPEFEFNGIKQQNRNGLLGRDPSVDGLKTGHTDSAGYCLVTSALRDGTRLVSVVLGSTSMKGREGASAALFNYGFTFYETKLAVKGGVALASAQVWKSEKTPIDVGIKDDLYLTLPRGESANVKTTAVLQPRLIAPLTAASIVGNLNVAAGAQILSIPLHPLHDTAAGGWWRRLIDTVRLWFA
jgi:serine-type D-Ala-D-Ala carboxypeptidase (penicillin-binding protein 5/6)